MMILIAGPYRGGTNDDPILIKRNLDKLESVALSLFRKGMGCSAFDALGRIKAKW